MAKEIVKPITNRSLRELNERSPELDIRVTGLVDSDRIEIFGSTGVVCADVGETDGLPTMSLSMWLALSEQDNWVARTAPQRFAKHWQQYKSTFDDSALLLETGGTQRLEIAPEKRTIDGRDWLEVAVSDNAGNKQLSISQYFRDPGKALAGLYPQLVGMSDFVFDFLAVGGVFNPASFEILTGLPIVTRRSMNFRVETDRRIGVDTLSFELPLRTGEDNQVVPVTARVSRSSLALQCPVSDDYAGDANKWEAYNRELARVGVHSPPTKAELVALPNPHLVMKLTFLGKDIAGFFARNCEDFTKHLGRFADFAQVSRVNFPQSWRVIATTPRIRYLGSSTEQGDVFESTVLSGDGETELPVDISLKVVPEEGVMGGKWILSTYCDVCAAAQLPDIGILDSELVGEAWRRYISTKPRILRHDVVISSAAGKLAVVPRIVFDESSQEYVYRLTVVDTGGAEDCVDLNRYILGQRENAVGKILSAIEAVVPQFQEFVTSDLEGTIRAILAAKRVTDPWLLKATKENRLSGVVETTVHREIDPPDDHRSGVLEHFEGTARLKGAPYLFPFILRYEPDEAGIALALELPQAMIFFDDGSMNIRRLSSKVQRLNEKMKSLMLFEIDDLGILGVNSRCYPVFKIVQGNDNNRTRVILTLQLEETERTALHHYATPYWDQLIVADMFALASEAVNLWV